MSRRFGRERRREVPRLNTSSLPDLIFTLLFFFMLVTNLRESRPKVDYRVPEAARAERLEKKSLVTTIYVGRAAGRDAPGAGGGFCFFSGAGQGIIGDCGNVCGTAMRKPFYHA